MKKTHKSAKLLVFILPIITYFSLKTFELSRLFSWVFLHTDSLLLIFALLFLGSAIVFLRCYRKTFLSYQVKTALVFAFLSLGTTFLWLGNLI